MDEYTRPDPSRAALLTIDVQNDFTQQGAPAEIEETADVVPEISGLLDAFRSAAAPIVHVVRLYRADGSNVDPCRRASIESGASVVRPGSEGADLVADLKPADDVTLDADRLLDGDPQELGPREWACYKPRWSAFFETRLGEFLDGLGVNTVVVCGCNFPNCPRATVYDASARDFRIVFVPDATSGTYERGIEELAGIGVAVKSTAETREWIRG